MHNLNCTIYSIVVALCCSISGQNLCWGMVIASFSLWTLRRLWTYWIIVFKVQNTTFFTVNFAHLLRTAYSNYWTFPQKVRKSQKHKQTEKWQRNKIYLHWAKANFFFDLKVNIKLDSLLTHLEAMSLLLLRWYKLTLKQQN